MIKEFFVCVDEPYATRVTYKQSNPDFISNSRMTRLIVDSQTLSSAAACRKLRLSAAASTWRRYCHTTLDEVLASHLDAI